MARHDLKTYDIHSLVLGSLLFLGLLVLIGLPILLIVVVLIERYLVLIVLLLGLVAVLVNSDQQKREEYIKNFISSEGYKFITNFVGVYKNNLVEQSTADRDGILKVGLDRISNFDPFIKLKELLEKKEYTFSEKELLSMIDDELNTKLYEDFKNKILRNKPNSLDSYIKNFVEIFGYSREYEDNPDAMVSILQKLLSEKGIQYEVSTLTQMIGEKKKEVELNLFEKRIESGESHITINEVDTMGGHEFEAVLKRLFERMGYKVETKTLSNDQGADLVISKVGERIVVQAKRYQGNVGNKAIQEAAAAKEHYKADRGIVVTNSEFTRQAEELARSNRIELIGRTKLQELLKKYG